jgi:DNA primase
MTALLMIFEGFVAFLVNYPYLYLTMSSPIPHAKIAEIKAAANVVDVIGDFLPLKKRGSNYFGLSPFTSEKSPSFAVSPSKNIWKDFSTNRGGDALGFLMEARGMSEAEGLIYLAQKFSVALPDSTVADATNAPHASLPKQQD